MVKTRSSVKVKADSAECLFVLDTSLLVLRVIHGGNCVDWSATCLMSLHVIILQVFFMVFKVEEFRVYEQTSE